MRWHKKSIDLGRKSLITILGVLILISSVILAPLPGPGGIPLALLGLSILAREYDWAKRLIARFKRLGTNLWKFVRSKN